MGCAMTRRVRAMRPVLTLTRCLLSASDVRHIRQHVSGDDRLEKMKHQVKLQS